MSLNLGDWVMNFIVMFTAISVHEYSHGRVAYALGDPTAKEQGRLTLNPLSHLDVLGAICMVLFRFGWAKPVPVNPMYFKNRKRDMAVVALAGPVSNVIFAFLTTVLYVPALIFLPRGAALTGIVIRLFETCVIMNISFAVFNLIPFPPLDGSKILGAALPNRTYYTLLQYERYGFIALILLSGTGILGQVLDVVRKPVFGIWQSFAQAFYDLIVKLVS